MDLNDYYRIVCNQHIECVLVFTDGFGQCMGMGEARSFFSIACFMHVEYNDVSQHTILWCHEFVFFLFVTFSFISEWTNLSPSISDVLWNNKWSGYWLFVTVHHVDGLQLHFFFSHHYYYLYLLRMLGAFNWGLANKLLNYVKQMAH